MASRIIERKHNIIPSRLEAAFVLLLLWCNNTVWARTLTWENAGPGGGGAFVSVEMDSQDFDTIHVGSDLGGYFKSTDGGKTFRVLNTGLTDYFITRILVDPAMNEIIYLATLSGVFKSTDRGMTWTPKRNGFPPLELYSHSAPVSSLAIDPTISETIYAGIGITREMTDGRGHIYKTVDGGESWELLDGISTQAGPAVICQIAIRYDDPAVLFAATNRGIFRSSDSGLTWEQRNSGLPHLFCRDIAIHPSNSDVMYAVMWSTPGWKPWRGGVYRSNDGGETWIERNGGLPRHVGLQGSEPQETTNYSRIALDPRNTEHLYVGSDSWWGAGLYESQNGGRTWKLCTISSDEPSAERGWIVFWADAINCLSMSPIKQEALVYGDAGKMMRTDDGGRQWKQLYTRALSNGRWQGNGLEPTCIFEITADPFSRDRLFCGYADIGLMVTEDGGQSWRQSSRGLPGMGDIARVVCDPQRESVAWCCEGKPFAAQGGIAMTTDGGNTWQADESGTNGLPSGSVGLLILDPGSPVNSRTLYVVSYGNGIYKSSDGGRSWVPMNEGLGRQPINVSDLVLDPRDSKRLFAARQWGEDDSLGGLYVMNEGAKRWQKVNRNTEMPDIKSIAFDPDDSRIMFIGCSEYYSEALGQTFSGGVFKSQDDGRTWEKLLDDRAAVCVRISSSDVKIIYAATTRYPYHDNAVGRGVVVSSDGGETWFEANDGLTNRNVIVISLDPFDPKLVYAGTGGNGFFVGRWE